MYRQLPLGSFGLCTLFLLLMACHADSDKKEGASLSASEAQIPFDSQKWSVSTGSDYPYREGMLSTLVYTDTLRRMTRDSILNVLGSPDRDTEGHLYYMIDQTRLGPWPLRSKFMVIKLTPSDTVEWIKIYE